MALLQAHGASSKPWLVTFYLWTNGTQFAFHYPQLAKSDRRMNANFRLGLNDTVSLGHRFTCISRNVRRQRAFRLLSDSLQSSEFWSLTQRWIASWVSWDGGEPSHESHKHFPAKVRFYTGEYYTRSNKMLSNAFEFRKTEWMQSNIDKCNRIQANAIEFSRLHFCVYAECHLWVCPRSSVIWELLLSSGTEPYLSLCDQSAR